MNTIIEDLRKTSAEHAEVKKYVNNFIKRAKEAAEAGDSMALVWTSGPKQEPAVVAELEKLGFKVCPAPITLSGTRGIGTYMTWI